jgi:hypothetical protein
MYSRTYLGQEEVELGVHDVNHGLGADHSSKASKVGDVWPALGSL